MRDQRNYAVYNGDGTICHSGMNEIVARRSAQRQADERGEPFFVALEGEQGGDDCEEFTPTTKTAVYGIAYGEGPDFVVEEHVTLEAAREAARAAMREGLAAEVDIVELEGTGPALDSDGGQVAPTHAPRRTLETVRPERGDWHVVEDGIWVSGDGQRVLVDDCDCGDEGCPGPADLEVRVSKVLGARGYSLPRSWDAVSDGQPHGQAIGRIR